MKSAVLAKSCTQLACGASNLRICSDCDPPYSVLVPFAYLYIHVIYPTVAHIRVVQRKGLEVAHLHSRSKRWMLIGPNYGAHYFI